MARTIQLVADKRQYRESRDAYHLQLRHRVLMIVSAESADAAMHQLAESGEKPVVIGEIVSKSHTPAPNELLLM